MRVTAGARVGGPDVAGRIGGESALDEAGGQRERVPPGGCLHRLDVQALGRPRTY